jgi:hypothetical protein
MIYSRKPGAFDEHLAYPENAEPPRTIWIACAPKTGSTLLTALLHKLLGWRAIWPLKKGFWKQPQELNMTADFGNYKGHVLIPQTHTMFNENSLHWIKEYNVDVVIPVRSLVDSLVSAAEHSKANSGLPFGHLPDDITTLAVEDRQSLIISLATSWYIQFYTGWHFAALNRKIRVTYTSYDHFSTKPADALKQLISDLHIQRSNDQIMEAIAYATPDVTRMNIGGSRLNKMTKDQLKLLNSIVHSASTSPQIKAALTPVWTPLKKKL